MASYKPTIRKADHLDYAAEAEAAQRGTAWQQAAALWRRAAEDLRASAPQNSETFDLHAKYQAAAAECDRRVAVDAELEKIAKRHLRIPTLRQRNAGHLDFYNEVDVWSVREALWAAYEAGRASTK